MQSKTLSENIADRIKQRIIVGKYAVGTQLPNEQELADSLNVSRTTIREAVKLLVSRRVLEIERGKGTFVAAIPGLSEDPFGLEFVNEDILKSNLSQFRSIIEPEVCALAAANASAHQLDDMKHLVVRMNEISCLVVESSVDEWIDEFIDQEIAFHTLIYKMTHNVVFERMTNIISHSVIINSTALNYRQGFDFTKYMELHTTLYEALASRDPEIARKHGQEHMETFKLFT